MPKVGRRIPLKKRLAAGGPINDPSNGAFGQTDPNAKKPDVAGNAASSIGKAVPMWGALFGMGETVSNQTKEGKTDFMHLQASRVQDPFGWAKGNKNAADWGKSLLDPSGLMDAFNGKTARAVRDAKAAKAAQDNVKNLAAGTNFYNTQNSMLSKPMYQQGGQLPSGEKVIKGGTARQVAPGVSEIISSNPAGTDNVETEGAMLDHKEIVDSKNRVFSNTLRLPSGETVAQKAKKIAGNSSQLNRLYQYQENNKPAMKKVTLPFSNKRNMNAGQPYTGNVPRKPQFALGGQILPRTSKDAKQDQPKTPAGKMQSHAHAAAKKIPIHGGNKANNDRPGPAMTSSTLNPRQKR